jgi:antirestriction protein ArdC
MAGIVAPLPEREIIPQAEALIAATGCDFRIGGDRAYYAPEADYVQVPLPQLYRVPIDFYRTAFHELGHNAATRIMPHVLVSTRLAA